MDVVVVVCRPEEGEIPEAPDVGEVPCPGGVGIRRLHVDEGAVRRKLAHLGDPSRRGDERHETIDHGIAVIRAYVRLIREKRVRDPRPRHADQPPVFVVVERDLVRLAGDVVLYQLVGGNCRSEERRVGKECRL